MTEDEAKTKWCPFFQVSAGMTGNDDVNNRMGLCLGSECMAWRWHLVRFKTTNIDGDVTAASTEINKVGGGYCGLAQFQYGGNL